MAGGIPRAVRLIAWRWAEKPGSGSAQGEEGGRWSQRARHLRFGATGQLDMPMTTERRRHGAQRLDTSESTRHPASPASSRPRHWAGSTLWPAAIARSSVFSQAIDDQTVAALISAPASS
jgi:hypothetical protein